MAKLFPPRYQPSNPNRGEKNIFDKFEKSKDTNDWYVLNSLLQQKHIEKKYGEIDFVILAPGYGIFCIEVKGSYSVQRINGKWLYKNKYGKIDYKKMESPFHQANSSMQSLKKYISDKLGKSYNNLNFGYGVAFTLINYTANSPEEEDYMIFDSVKMRSMSIDKYIKTMSKNFHLKNRNTQKFPDKDDIKSILKILRGDFEYVPSMSKILEDENIRIKKFTNQQFEIFDSHSNKKRMLVKGGPGTGKTVIAIEVAKRFAFNKKRILITCFNRNLGDWLLTNFNSDELKYISVGNIHSFVGTLLLRFQIPNERFLEEAPFRLLESLEKDEFKPYDALIVDETQDLIDPEYLEIFSILLKNGIKNGNWIMFGDFISQSLFTEKSDDEMYHLINSKVDEELHVCFLKRNIRNTMETALAAIVLSAPYEKPYTLTLDRSCPTLVNFYKDKNSLKDEILKMFTVFKKENYDYSKIIILSPYKFENSILSSIINKTPPISKFSVNQENRNVKFATIQSFKGLEMEHVVILEIDDISSNEKIELFFNAATRSTFSLTLMINDKLKNLYTRRQLDTHEMYSDELQ